MFTRLQYSRFLFVNIETVPLYDTYESLRKNSPFLLEEFKRKYDDSCLDESKSIEETYLEKSTFSPEFSRVCSVSFGTFDPNYADDKRIVSFSGEDELDILKKSNKIINNSEDRSNIFRICGFMIKRYTVPFLGRRMLYNGIIPSTSLKVLNKKPWETNFIDLSEVFSFGSWEKRGDLSLSLLSLSVGVETRIKDHVIKETIKDISEGYYQGIEEISESKILSMMQIVEKISE